MKGREIVEQKNKETFEMLISLKKGESYRKVTDGSSGLRALEERVPQRRFHY